jgi:hypothetical protein
LRSRSKWVDDVDDVEVHVDLRLLVMPSLLCRHSCRHLFSAWCIGNSRPSSQIFPERPRGPRGGSMRSLGQRDLWVTGPQGKDALPHKLNRRQGVRKRQNVNNQTTTTNSPSPAGFLPATSKAVPHNFLVLRHPLHRLKLYSLEQAPSSSTRCDVAGSDRALRGFVGVTGSDLPFLDGRWRCDIQPTPTINNSATAEDDEREGLMGLLISDRSET